MAVHYNLSTWDSSTSMEAREFRKVRKLDAALSETWKQIYAMCAADGALDTERAHRLLREFRQLETDCAASHPLSGRHYFSRDFVLRTDAAGKLAHVRFVAVRER
jgi:hypothetical protein